MNAPLRPALLPVTGILAVLLATGGCARFRSAKLPPPVAPAATLATVAPRPLDPAWLQPSAEAFTLGPGDKVEIEIASEEASRVVVPVGPDGKIYFHVLPGLEVWGMTTAEARVALEEALKQFYREAPRVTVTLHEVGSKQVWLLGRLNAPGIYPLKGPTTLLEGIALAGGPAPTPVFATLTSGGTATFAGGSDEAADLRRAFLIRGGAPLPVDFQRLLREGDMAQNIYLQPDDLVYLPSAVSQEIHVLGAVGQPKAVAYTGQTTLLTAISAAGGTLKEAHLAQVAVVRGGFSEPQIMVVDYRDLVRGQAADVALEPNDIVYVPFAPYRALTRYVELILTTFARTIGVNAGARAVSRGEAIGISVPVGP